MYCNIQVLIPIFSVCNILLITYTPLSNYVIVYNCCRLKRKLLCCYKSLRNMSYRSYLRLCMIQSYLHLSSFKHIRRLASEIKIMFLLVFVESLEELYRICISIGSFMKPCKFVVITSQKKRLRKWQPWLQDWVVALWLTYIMWKRLSCFVAETIASPRIWYLSTPLQKGRSVNTNVSLSHSTASLFSLFPFCFFC